VGADFGLDFWSWAIKGLGEKRHTFSLDWRWGQTWGVDVFVRKGKQVVLDWFARGSPGGGTIWRIIDFRTMTLTGGEGGAIGAVARAGLAAFGA